MRYILYSIAFLILFSACQSDKSIHITNGYAAPLLELPDIHGQKQKLLAEYKPGQYVLYQFWASWCAPCRQNNKTLSSWLAEGKMKNLRVISISFDIDKDKWLNGIREDSLFWPDQYSDLSGGNSDAMQALGIVYLPYCYLVNPKGKIMAVNPRLHRLEEILADQ